MHWLRWSTMHMNVLYPGFPVYSFGVSPRFALSNTFMFRKSNLPTFPTGRMVVSGGVTSPSQLRSLNAQSCQLGSVVGVPSAFFTHPVSVVWWQVRILQGSLLPVTIALSGANRTPCAEELHCSCV